MHCLNRKTGPHLVNANCDVAEDNKRDREHYESEWLDNTRPRGKITLSENDTVRKETYEQEQVINFQVRRSPGQKMGVGRQGEMLKQYQLPYKNVLPVPMFLPRKVVPFKDSERAHTPADFKPIIGFEQALSNGLLTASRNLGDVVNMEMAIVSKPMQFPVMLTRCLLHVD
ncbi:hypothetical protein SKAU_G00400960 [Synaphobranchus kaupii]|uniref:Telethonin n=1 Tax=Synaphobranchus kaupii TaxID=118154 RepID=A0A9Q1ICD3_SYNKA|nr:hypothetical protein SKAU_G00400960 [Synaphobranchus kaupii]